MLGGPREFEIWFNSPRGLHHHDAGVIEEGLRLIQVANPRVELSETTEDSVVYRITW